MALYKLEHQCGFYRFAEAPLPCSFASLIRLTGLHEMTQSYRLIAHRSHSSDHIAVAARSVDAALRRSIPAFNRDVKDVQNRMEDVSFKLRIPQRKPWQGMADNVQASLVLAQQPDKV